jgi:hypothetical protein
MKKLIFVVLAGTLVYTTTYFDCGSNYLPPSPGGGFYVETTYNGSIAPGTLVSGQWKQDYPGAGGSDYDFPPSDTDIVGNLAVEYGRAPALWNFTEHSGPCENQSVDGDTTPDKTTYLACLTVFGLGIG